MNNGGSEKGMEHIKQLYHLAKKHFDTYIEYYGELEQEHDGMYKIGKGGVGVFIIAGTHFYENESTFPAITESFDLLVNEYKQLLDNNEFNFIIIKPAEDLMDFINKQVDEKNPTYVLDLHSGSPIRKGFYIEASVHKNKEETEKVAKAMLNEVKNKKFRISQHKYTDENYPIKFESPITGLVMGGITEEYVLEQLLSGGYEDIVLHSALKGVVSLTLESYDFLPEPHLAAIEGFYKYLNNL